MANKYRCAADGCKTQRVVSRKAGTSRYLVETRGVCSHEEVSGYGSWCVLPDPLANELHRLLIGNSPMVALSALRRAHKKDKHVKGLTIDQVRNFRNRQNRPTPKSTVEGIQQWLDTQLADPEEPPGDNEEAFVPAAKCEKDGPISG